MFKKQSGSSTGKGDKGLGNRQDALVKFASFHEGDSPRRAEGSLRKTPRKIFFGCSWKFF